MIVKFNDSHIRNSIEVLFLILCITAVTSCQNERKLSYAGISEEYYDEVSTNALAIQSGEVRNGIQQLAEKDFSSSSADKYTKDYYKSGGNFIWVSRYGITPQAQYLINFLDSIELDGFAPSKTHAATLRQQYENVTQLAYADDAPNKLNESLAQLEYYLTKALLRYGVGMRYGFTHPHNIYNNVDIRDSDSVHVTYRKLFDIPVYHNDMTAYSQALESVKRDSLMHFLNESQPKNPLYFALKKKLKGSQGSERNKILVNMERARWRTPDAPYEHEEYIIVNIPSYHLWATNADSTLSMRIGCGSHKTKTPLLHSRINRMDINPQWIIPRSIREKELAYHAGDSSYFEKRNYFARNHKTNNVLRGSQITYDVIMSKDYSIIQKGGDGNSLGKIIFRFPNNHSVYLHDTSSPQVFKRDNRSVSHGCVRVAKPFELAKFLLRGKHSDVAERIKYSMENDINGNGINKGKLISSYNVEPAMPLYIEYYTMFQAPDGNVIEYPDVYGYDPLLLNALKRYM